MFEHLKEIPYSTQQIQDEYDVLNEIYAALCEYIHKDRTAGLRWNSYNVWGIMARLILRINALNGNMNTPKKALLRYYMENDYDFIKQLEALDEYPERYGLLIHAQVSTHFETARFADYKHLEGAEKVLKQTPTHFLKIMQHPKADTLVIFTNKELSIENCYKLNELHNKMLLEKYPEWSPVPYRIAQAMTRKDIKAFKEILTELFNSDDFKKLRMEKLKKVFTYDTDRQIANIESDIANYRRSILDYENRIADCAIYIRNSSEQLMQLKSRDLDEDFELTCKYLWKHPYIKSYEPSQDGYITFKYEAPLIYFDESPAEKLLHNPNYSTYAKTIIKMMLERRFELYTQCRIRFNTVTYNTHSEPMNNEPLLGHPHIDRFNCFGNHRDAISDSAINNDYIGAIEQISQAVLNLNFYDACVIDYLLRTLLDYQDTLYTWKDTETGEMLTTNEALKKGGYFNETA